MRNRSRNVDDKSMNMGVLGDGVMCMNVVICRGLILGLSCRNWVCRNVYG